MKKFQTYFIDILTRVKNF